MHDRPQPHRPADHASDRLSLRDARGHELVVEAREPERPAEGQTVVATNGEGKSLTLLEEYTLRNQRPGIGQIALSAICAIASLAFAALIYFKTY